MNYDISAIILAAGFSSRMNGDFKPLMQIGRYSAIQHAVMCFQKAGINSIKVVVGFRADDVVKEVEHLKVSIIYNPNFSEGMYCSIQAGVNSLSANTRKFFILPVDLPLISSTTIDKLLKYGKSIKAGIIYPTFEGERGHPPLIDIKYKNEILQGGKNMRLREILELYDNESFDLKTDDEAILLDMDTLEDYQDLKRFYYKKTPDLENCLNILITSGVSNNIEKHCFAVACTAFDIVCKLNNFGAELDEKLVIAGAMLHDIVRHEPNHALKGKKLLYEKYPLVAEIVASHMDMEVDENEDITEAEIVYYADKIVCGSTLTSISRRFNKMLQKYGNESSIKDNILKRMSESKKIENKIQNIINLHNYQSDIFGGSWL